MLSKILICIPVYNENRVLPTFLKELLKQYPNKLVDLLFINDGSTDSSLDIIKSFCIHKNIKIINNFKRYDLGSVIYLGFKYALDNNYTFCIYFPSSNRIKISSLDKFIHICYQKEKNFFLIGSRFCEGGFSENQSFLKKYIIIFFSFLISKIFSVNLSDITSGIRAIAIADWEFPIVPFNSKIMGEQLLSINAIKKKLDVFEIPVHVTYNKKLRPYSYVNVRRALCILYPWIIYFFTQKK